MKGKKGSVKSIAMHWLRKDMLFGLGCVFDLVRRCLGSQSAMLRFPLLVQRVKILVGIA